MEIDIVAVNCITSNTIARNNILCAEFRSFKIYCTNPTATEILITPNFRKKLRKLYYTEATSPTQNCHRILMLLMVLFQSDKRRCSRCYEVGAHQGDLYKPTLDTWLEEDEIAGTIDNTGEDDAVALAPVGENDDQEAAMALLEFVFTMESLSTNCSTIHLISIATGAQVKTGTCWRGTGYRLENKRMCSKMVNILSFERGT